MTTFAIHDAKAIKGLLAEGGMVEVFLDDERNPYAASLCPEHAGGEMLRLTPLEPAVGNMRIRHARRVRVRLFQHDASLEGWCRYLGRYVIDGRPCVALSLPETLVQSFVRHEPRLDLSRHPLAAHVLPAGWSRDLAAEVDDLSPEGMALTTADEEAELAESSQVNIRLPFSGERDVLLAGTVQSRHLLRRPEDPYRVVRRYGVHFDYYRLDREHFRRFRQLLAQLNGAA